jgi:hypothetical protein
MKKMLTAAALALATTLALADPYFTDVRWHPGHGNPHDAEVYFTVPDDEAGELVKYTAVGLATLTETCSAPDGTPVWSLTEFMPRAYTTTYQAVYTPGEHSAQIKSTNFPSRANFPVCFAPNTLRLDAVNWLAVTLYDQTTPDVLQYPAVRDDVMP